MYFDCGFIITELLDKIQGTLFQAVANPSAVKIYLYLICSEEGVKFAATTLSFPIIFCTETCNPLI
jgi:hypothetical protein